MARGEGGYGHSVGRLLDELRPSRSAPPAGPAQHGNPRVWKVISAEEAARRSHPALVGPAGQRHRTFRSTEWWAAVVVSVLIFLALFGLVVFL